MCFKIPWDYSDDDNLFSKWEQVNIIFKFYRKFYIFKQLPHVTMTMTESLHAINVNDAVEKIKISAVTV